MLSTEQRKKISIISKYCISEFQDSDWFEFGQITGSVDKINRHPRLLRALSFGDDDYETCVVEVIDEICSDSPELVDIIVDHYDIELWYQSKEPQKFHKIFGEGRPPQVDFWSERTVRVFFSHLVSNRDKVGRLARELNTWGLDTFVAHDDIEPSLEWLAEIEKALLTMDALVAVVEEGFRDSNWCDQEVGYAFGRKIDVFPLRNGKDPYGFMGKFQGLQIKSRYPNEIAVDLLKLMLKKRRLYSKLISSLPIALSRLDSKKRTDRLTQIESWNIIPHKDIKSILESSSLSPEEKQTLADIIEKTGAYPEPAAEQNYDDIPF